MRYFYLLCGLTIAVFLSYVTSSSVADEALRLADGLFDMQSYDESITEYKRFIFFNPVDKRASYAFYKIGLAYRAEGHWAEAIDALKTAVNLTDDGKTKDERRIELGITLIASGNISFAQLELLKVSEFSQYPDMRRQSSYFQGIAYLYMFNWESARRDFRKYYSSSPEKKDSEKARRIDALLDEAKYLPNKSVTIAKTLSTILPGTGQFYAGDWKNGLNALAINGLTTAFFLNSVLKKNYQDATLIFFLLFQRYYMGNRYRASSIVEKYNENLSRQHASKILQTLLEAQKGNQDNIFSRTE